MKKFLILMMMAGALSITACNKKADTTEEGGEGTEPAAQEEAVAPAEEPVEAEATMGEETEEAGEATEGEAKEETAE